MIEGLKVECRYVCKKNGTYLGENRKEVKQKLGIGASRFASMFRKGLISIEIN